MKAHAWILAAISLMAVDAATAPQSVPAFVPVTDAVLRNPAPADWLRWRRDHAATGDSPLDEIERRNVHKLRLAWVAAMEPGVQESEPSCSENTAEHCRRIVRMTPHATSPSTGTTST